MVQFRKAHPVEREACILESPKTRTDTHGLVETSAKRSGREKLGDPTSQYNKNKVGRPASVQFISHIYFSIYINSFLLLFFLFFLDILASLMSTRRPFHSEITG